MIACPHWKRVYLNIGVALLLLFFLLIIARHKNGYLMFLEQKMFGSSWIRMYFAIKNGKLESPEVSINGII